MAIDNLTTAIAVILASTLLLAAFGGFLYIRIKRAYKTESQARFQALKNMFSGFSDRKLEAHKNLKLLELDNPASVYADLRRKIQNLPQPSYFEREFSEIEKKIDNIWQRHETRSKFKEVGKRLQEGFSAFAKIEETLKITRSAKEAVPRLLGEVLSEAELLEAKANHPGVRPETRSRLKRLVETLEEYQKSLRKDPKTIDWLEKSERVQIFARTLKELEGLVRSQRASAEKTQAECQRLLAEAPRLLERADLAAQTQGHRHNRSLVEKARAKVDEAKRLPPDRVDWTELLGLLIAIQFLANQAPLEEPSPSAAVINSDSVLQTSADESLPTDMGSDSASSDSGDSGVSYGGSGE